MDSHTDPITSEQSTRSATNQTTISERINKYKIPPLSDRETGLTKINIRMWWEQKSEYIHFTYHRNEDEILDQGIEHMDGT